MKQRMCVDYRRSVNQAPERQWIYRWQDLCFAVLYTFGERLRSTSEVREKDHEGVQMAILVDDMVRIGCADKVKPIAFSFWSVLFDTLEDETGFRSRRISVPFCPALYAWRNAMLVPGCCGSINQAV